MPNIPSGSTPDNRQDGAPFGSPQAVFETLDELAALAGIHAQQIQLYASTGDMAGVEYTTRRLWAYMRAIGGIVRDFKEHGHTLGKKGQIG